MATKKQDNLSVDTIKRCLAVYAISIDGFDSLSAGTQQLLTDCAVWMRNQLDDLSKPATIDHRCSVDSANLQEALRKIAGHYPLLQRALNELADELDAQDERESKIHEELLNEMHDIYGSGE